MTRAELEMKIINILGVSTADQALDKLQLETALVSDNAVKLSDVSDGDLIRAYQEISK